MRSGIRLFVFKMKGYKMEMAIMFLIAYSFVKKYFVNDDDI